MSRCRQTIAMPVNFAFLVPHAIMKGLTKLAFCESSVPFVWSVCWSCCERSVGNGDAWC